MFIHSNYLDNILFNLDKLYRTLNYLIPYYITHNIKRINKKLTDIRKICFTFYPNYNK